MMRKTITVFAFFSVLLIFNACKKDEGLLPEISFKTGGSYISADANVAKGSNITMGITASKAEEEDVLKKFNISRSLNGGSATSVFSKDLSGTEGDTYDYDYNTTLDTLAGQTYKYTFTVTNRDGLVNQVSLTVTTQ